MPKFFIRADRIVGQKVTFDGDDAFHISRSLRMARGQHVVVIDEEGMEYDCVLSDFTPDTVTGDVLSQKKNDGEPPVRISLYQGLPKGDKLDTVIQKAVECGCSEIIPFESERCVAKVKPETEAHKTERRNKIAAEAAKQCGRGKIPVVGSTLSYKQALERATGADLCLICYEDERGTTLKDVLKARAQQKLPESISVLVGSEGGFSGQEVKMAVECGAVSVSLGKRILRTETVSGFLLGCLSYEFEM